MIKWEIFETRVEKSGTNKKLKLLALRVMDILENTKHINSPKIIRQAQEEICPGTILTTIENKKIVFLVFHSHSRGKYFLENFEKWFWKAFPCNPLYFREKDPDFFNKRGFCREVVFKKNGGMELKELDIAVKFRKDLLKKKR